MIKLSLIPKLYFIFYAFPPGPGDMKSAKKKGEINNTTTQKSTKQGRCLKHRACTLQFKLILFSHLFLISWDKVFFFFFNFSKIDEFIYTDFWRVMQISLWTNIFLTGYNWQNWKRVFPICHCHKIHRVEAIGLKNHTST